MADLALAPLIDATLSNVISAVSELINLAVDGKNELARLRTRLDQVRVFLLDAGEKQVRDPLVRRWLEKLRDLGRDIEDVLDEFVYEGLKHKVESRGQGKKQVSFLFTHPSMIPSMVCDLFRPRMVNKIKNLITSVDEINKEAGEYGLQYRLAVSASESRSNPQTARPFLGYCSQVIGREDDVSNLIDLLIDPSNKQPLSVISVVGMGGLGKTTLVKSVEEAEKIREHFGNIMSVCVSEDFDVKRILKHVLECLTKESCSLENERAIMDKIKGKLENKNYLLILDDVWNEDELKWEELRGCLLEINKKKVSRVVVTTRSEKVADTMGTRKEHKYHLKQLKHDECWSIIKRRVFEDSPVHDQELEKIGRQIAKKCRGVPLVANIIGASLSTRIGRPEWLSVQNSDAWDSLKDDGNGRGILGVLQLSFDRLPNPALKQCFAFCSIFPKDFAIERDRLVQLWMAGGFLGPSEGSSVATLEDIGDEYFDDLFSSSLLQEAARDSYGKIVSCKMHDLIHDLATSNSKSETLILKAGSKGNIAHVRHLNLVDDMETMPTNFEEVAGKLHALFVEGDILCKLPECFKRLRILRLDGQCYFGEHCIEQLPTWIGEMKHLRFLEISRTRIKELPEFIMKLYRLQTLRYERCDFIEKRPEGLGNLINLKHICFSHGGHVPVGIGGLADLQTLPFFVVGRQEGSRIEELGSLSQLRGRLEISCLEFVDNNIEAKKAKLCEKTRLHELVLNWGFSDREECKHDEGVLEGLQPPSNVRSLTIEFYGGEKCPSWMDCSFSELLFLNIESCRKLKSIPTMRGFSALQELYIRECFELTDMGDDVSALLTSLRRLIIQDCPKLQTIGHSLSSLTCLVELRLRGCRNLRPIPSVDGLSSLKELTIEGCDGLVSPPTGLSSCTALEELHICNCRNLISISEDLMNLHSLIELRISYCENLRCIPEKSLSCLVRLQKLRIGGFSEELEQFPGLSSIQRLDASLRSLTLIGWETLKYLPPQIQRLTSLEELYIHNFNQVEALPEWLGSLSSLQILVIEGCKNLKCLPNSAEAKQRLSELPYLKIDGCPGLAERFAKKRGPKFLLFGLKAWQEAQHEVLLATTEARWEQLQEEMARHVELNMSMRGEMEQQAHSVESEQSARDMVEDALSHEDFIEQQAHSVESEQSARDMVEDALSHEDFIEQQAHSVESEQSARDMVEDALSHEGCIEGDLAVKRKRTLELLPQLSSQQASKRCKHDGDWTKP